MGPVHLPVVVLLGFLSFLRLASLAATAILAISDRRSGVSFSIRAAALSFPPFAPCWRKNSLTSGGSGMGFLGTF